jgi:glutamate 5-kinase
MNKIKRVVIKIGTKSITSGDRSINTGRIGDIVSQSCAVRDKGIDVILVTSGAIGAGMHLLGLKKRPVELSYLQAAAAIGQNQLMHIYSEHFKSRGYIAAQILLTREDFNDKARRLNIKHTIDKILSHKAVPIINENDTVATDEIRCGDNDRLSALVADICGADKLVLLTDVDGLLDSDGNLVRFVECINHKILKLGGKSHCDLGTGGMATKIEAARIAMSSGIDCIIANSGTDGVIKKIILDHDSLGTVFKSGAVRKKRKNSFTRITW